MGKENYLAARDEYINLIKQEQVNLSQITGI